MAATNHPLHIRTVTCFRRQFISVAEEKKNYFMLINVILLDSPKIRLEAPRSQQHSATDSGQSTTEMFFDMFTKKGKLLSKLTSFDSEVRVVEPFSSSKNYSTA